MSNGLAVKEEDCKVTKCVRAAFYTTDLKPTEDHVIGFVIVIKEDLLDE